MTGRCGTVVDQLYTCEPFYWRRL